MKTLVLCFDPFKEPYAILTCHVLSIILHHMFQLQFKDKTIQEYLKESGIL